MAAWFSLAEQVLSLNVIPSHINHTVQRLGSIVQIWHSLNQFDEDYRPYSSNILVLLAMLKAGQERWLERAIGSPRRGGRYLSLSRPDSCWLDGLDRITGLDIKMAALSSLIYRAKGWDSPGDVAHKIGLRPEDVVAVAFEDDPVTHCPRFMIYVDHEMFNVVLLIRGTWGFKDLVADIVCEEKPFLDGFAHEGILHGALNILEKTRDVLQTTLQNHFGYHLLVAGHSMGGSTGELVCLELLLGEGSRNILPPGVDVHCITFGASPVYRPAEGSTLPLAIRRKIKIFKYRWDPVPSLSLGSIAKLLKVIRAVDGHQPAFSLLLQSNSQWNLESVIHYLETVQQDKYPYLEHPGTLLLLQKSEGRLTVKPGDQREVCENLILHESMIFDHLHTTYAKIFTNN